MILKGKPIADKIFAGLKKLDTSSKKLVIIQIGEDKASSIYVGKKSEMAKELGVKLEVKNFNEEIKFSELEGEIKALNGDESVGGVMIQMPIPSHIDRREICSKITPKKDIDGFDYIVNGRSSTLPPTILAIDETLNFYGISKKDKKILIVGGGFLVGSPLYHFYRSLGLDVSLLKSGDEKYFEKLRGADITILSTGGGARFGVNHFAERSTVIDASTIASDSKLIGDLDTANIGEKFHYSPVPGGVGPVTVAMLFANFFKLNDL